MVELYNTLSRLIHQFGTKRVLEELIENYYDEADYIVKLKQDLEMALKNYKSRYN